MENITTKATNEVFTSPPDDDQARRELLARIYRLILSSDWTVEEDEAESESDGAAEKQPAG